MEQRVRFSTQEQAETRQLQCLADWLLVNPEVDGYVCKRWDTPKQTLSGDWDIKPCPFTDHSNDNLVPFNKNDYEIPASQIPARLQV